MASAGQQISDTYELLDMILYKLPTRDLLLYQRVSKQWKSLIGTSKKLQQALFMMPVEAYRGRLVIKDCKHEPPCDTRNDHIQRTFTFYRNPLIDPFLKSLQVPHPDNLFMDTLPESWRYPDASWRKMVLVHPPWKTSAVICYGDYEPKDPQYPLGAVYCSVANYGVVEDRLGELERWLKEALEPESGFRVTYVQLKMQFDITKSIHAILELKDLKELEYNQQLEDWKRELESIRDQEEWEGRV